MVALGVNHDHPGPLRLSRPWRRGHGHPEPVARPHDRRCATAPIQRWPHRRVNFFALHQWTAYLTVALVLAHPVVLLWLKAPRFNVFDLLWPIHSPLQPWINLTGAVAIYLVLLLVVTSLLRHRLGRPLWRKLHYLAFPTLVLVFIHSIFTDPLLKDGHPDLLDGGKIFLEIALRAECGGGHRPGAPARQRPAPEARRPRLRGPGALELAPCRSCVFRRRSLRLGATSHFTELSSLWQTHRKDTSPHQTQGVPCASVPAASSLLPC